jgi:uncharacterized membrane protein
MNKRKLSKQAVAIITEYGAAIVIAQIIKENVTAPKRIDKRVAVALATFAIGGIVVAAASKYIQGFIDDIYDSYDRIKNS